MKGGGGRRHIHEGLMSLTHSSSRIGMLKDSDWPSRR